MSSLFISYRRKSWPFTHRLANELERRLDANIFVDFDDIDEPDFEHSILRHLRASDAVLLVISEHTFSDRIHRDEDWVRREIREALQHDIPLILVCVEGRLPPPGLPEDIQDVTRMQGINFYPEYFSDAVDRLANFVVKVGVAKRREAGHATPPESLVAEKSIVGGGMPSSFSLAAQMLLDAYTLFRAEEYVQAHRLLQDCLRLDPDHTEAQKLLIVVEQRLPPPRVADLLPPPFAWIDIPAGRVKIEAHGWFDVAAFAMAQYPVTNAQFQVFVEAKDGYGDPQWWGFSKGARDWRADHSKPQDTAFSGDDLPRTNVCWYEAVAFCRWLSARSGEAVRLPTEMEWQRAAQGDDGRVYPWGNEFDVGRCNTDASGIGQPTPVTAYPNGASPYGVMDMSGNVWEWCANAYPSPRLTDVTGDAKRRVLRGGSWYRRQGHARAVFRSSSNPVSRFDLLGFRVVRPPSL